MTDDSVDNQISASGSADNVAVATGDSARGESSGNGPDVASVATEKQSASVIATAPNRYERKGTPEDPDASQFMAYAKQLFIPIIVTKSFIMYFGLNYSMYPGEGYGYGLACAIGCGVASFSYFIWSQYRQ